MAHVRLAPVFEKGWLAAASGRHWVRWRVLHVCVKGGLPISVMYLDDSWACRQCGSVLELNPAAEVLPDAVREISPRVAAVAQRRLAELWQVWCDAERGMDKQKAGESSDYSDVAKEH